MSYVEEYIINSDNINSVNDTLTSNLVDTLIIEDVTKDVYISNIHIKTLIIRNVINTVSLSHCKITTIKCENSPSRLKVHFCNIYNVSGNYYSISLNNSDLKDSIFTVKDLYLRCSDITKSKITIKERIDLTKESNVHYSIIDFLEDSKLKSNVIIYNNVGSRGDNLIIFKKSKLVNTGCFHDSIYEFIIRVYDELNRYKCQYSVGVDYKCYEEYLNIIEEHSEDLFSSNELLIYKALKLTLKLYYKFNNPYK